MICELIFNGIDHYLDQNGLSQQTQSVSQSYSDILDDVSLQQYIEFLAMIRNLDLLSSLACNSFPSLQAFLISPGNLSKVLRLSIEGSMVDQIFAHRILQTMLRFEEMNENVLQQGITQLNQIEKSNHEAYSTQNDVTFENASFMQLLFDQISTRPSRKDFSKAEIRRTVKTVLLEGTQKFPNQITSLK